MSDLFLHKLDRKLDREWAREWELTLDSLQWEKVLDRVLALMSERAWVGEWDLTSDSCQREKVLDRGLGLTLGTQFCVKEGW